MDRWESGGQRNFGKEQIGMAHRDSITIRFEGDSGDGIISMGKVAARTASRMGFHVYTYSTFLAVVRGGQVTFQLRLGAKPLLSQGNNPDIMVALNRQAIVDNAPHMSEGGLLLHPPCNGLPVTPARDVVPLEIPYEELAISETGSNRAKNMVAVGTLLGMLGLSESEGVGVVREMFGGKSPEVADQNAAAFAAGYEEGKRRADQAAGMTFPPPESRRRLLLSGNEAAALGALVAGVRFFAGYPITPASEIMEWLAAYLPKVGGTMIQAEDEISSIGMCIGASYGGVKTMTATSGPGLSLMVELLGLAGMAEIPVVVVDVQRAGPSTGMPTKEAQGDLNLAVHGTHGEVPRVVLAPQTVSGCFEQTVRAVNIAHQYHIPVIVLSSQSLSHRMQTIDIEDLRQIEAFEEPVWKPETATGPYLRFCQTPDGMPSPRSVPGTPGGMYRAGGLEHDESGTPNFDPEIRTRMVERRRQRLHAIERAFSETVKDDGYVPHSGPLGIVSWGATASTAREVIQDFEKDGLVFSSLMPRVLWPMPDHTVREFLGSGVKYLFVCELNATRQFAEMIRARYTPELIHHDIEVISITKDDGLPFTPGEIRAQITQALAQRGIISSTEASQ